jgi:hypothetical protein
MQLMTWDEWFTYLDSFIDTGVPTKLAEVRQFLELSEQCRVQLQLVQNDLRTQILDELWAAALRLIYVDLLAAESHRRNAARLHLGWQQTRPADAQRAA